MEHIRGAPYHPQTQGKIERWHQTLKNHILLENYYLPGDLEAQIEAFVADYNHLRYHEAIDNLTPEDAYSGGVRPFSSKGKGSNARQSPIVTCCTVSRPHNITSQTSQSLSLFKPPPVPKTLTTDMGE
jgi:Integrase core domain